MTANVTERKSHSNQNTTIAALVHIAGLLFGFFALALVYLASDNEFTKSNAANALNWHIPISLVAILVAMIGLGVSELVGVAIALLIATATICFAVIACIKAYEGQAWQYPIVPQLI